jgi:hypothetical protein
MSRRTPGSLVLAVARHGEHGVALVFCLLLLAVFALLGLSTLSAAVVELRLAQNADLQERAFHAAEYAIDEAVQAVGLSTTHTFSVPRTMPATGTVPVAVPGAAGAGYSFRLYFAQATPIVEPDPTAPPSGQLEFHFVVEATGHAARGAADTHVQGFKILRDAGWTSDAAACSPGPACVAATAPLRTFWYAEGGE